MMVRLPLPTRFHAPSIIAVLVLTAAGIIGMGVHHSVNIKTIPDGSTTTDGAITISGKAADTTLKIQGYTITGSPDGTFSHSVTLAPGYNEIRVDAISQSGKTTSETIRVVRTIEPPRLVRGESTEPLNP